GLARVPLHVGQAEILAAAGLSLSRLYELTAGLIVLAWLAGRTRIFVNRSSLFGTYESALRRCYLVASNAERLSTMPLAQSHPGDGIEWHDYHPEQFGGPVHHINTTIN